MKTKIRPMNERVLIKRLEADTKIGSIILPDVAKEKPKRGRVVSIGAKVETVAKGDEVLFSAYAGTEIKVDDEEMLIVNEEDILAVVEVA